MHIRPQVIDNNWGQDMAKRRLIKEACSHMMWHNVLTNGHSPTMTAEDKQIEILYLQIRLAKLNWNNSAHSLSSQTPHAHASSSQIPHARTASRALSSQISHASSSCALSSHIPHHSKEVSTPSSGMSSLSYIHSRHSDSFVNTFMTSMDSESDCYHVPDVGADMASWPETYNFAV